MSTYFRSVKLFSFLALSSSLLAFTGCSPKVKMGLWANKHQDAATALVTWGENNPIEAATLLNIDCMDRKQFKKKITDALNSAPPAQEATQGYDVRQHNYHYGNYTPNHSEDGFGDWCRKYPQAAKKLRSHAKALCKTGLGLLSGTIKIN